MLAVLAVVGIVVSVFVFVFVLVLLEEVMVVGAVSPAVDEAAEADGEEDAR